MPPKKVGDWIETETGNKISRKALIVNPQNIILAGKSIVAPDVTLRGDLVRTLPSSSSTGSAASASGGAAAGAAATVARPTAQVAISCGRHVHFDRGAIIHPPSRLHRGTFSHHPLKIGDHVYIGQDAKIQAAAIGSNVYIGKGAVLGNMSMVRDGVKILEGAVVPDGMVIPSGWIVGGRPARWVADVGVGWEGPGAEASRAAHAR